MKISRPDQMEIEEMIDQHRHRHSEVPAVCKACMMPYPCFAFRMARKVKNLEEFRRLALEGIYPPTDEYGNYDAGRAFESMVEDFLIAERDYNRSERINVY